MNEKIEWYKEVLEVEPQARLFYPLARLLAGEGRAEEACQYLKAGLGFHPTHMEARMFYAELLRGLGRDEECAREVQELVKALSPNAGFWRAWADRLEGSDQSLTMRCVALSLRGVNVSFSDLLRRGLDSLEAELDSASGSEAAKAEPEKTAAQAPVKSEPAAAPAAAAAETRPEPAAVRPPLTAAVPLQAEDDFSDEDAEDGSVEEDSAWTPRTRTMAEIMFDQGEFAEAVDIYRELVSRAGSEAQAAELRARLAEIEAKAGIAARKGKAAEDSASPLDQRDDTLPPEELFSLLDGLAARMESRAR